MIVIIASISFFPFFISLSIFWLILKNIFYLNTFHQQQQPDRFDELPISFLCGISIWFSFFSRNQLNRSFWHKLNVFGWNVVTEVVAYLVNRKNLITHDQQTSESIKTMRANHRKSLTFSRMWHNNTKRHTVRIVKLQVRLIITDANVFIIRIFSFQFRLQYHTHAHAHGAICWWTSNFNPAFISNKSLVSLCPI